MCNDVHLELQGGGFVLQKHYFFIKNDRVIPGDRGYHLTLERLNWVWEEGLAESLEEKPGRSLGEGLGVGL